MNTSRERRDAVMKVVFQLIEDAVEENEFERSSINTTVIKKVRKKVLSIRNDLAGGRSAAAEAFEKTPANDIDMGWMDSIGEHEIVCLECGKKLKSLSKHIQAKHEMSVDFYKTKHGIPQEISLVARKVTEERRERAKRMGLGSKTREK
jgi:predicted transcriptional regulator